MPNVTLSKNTNKMETGENREKRRNIKEERKQWQCALFVCLLLRPFRSLSASQSSCVHAKISRTGGVDVASEFASKTSIRALSMFFLHHSSTKKWFGTLAKQESRFSRLFVYKFLHDSKHRRKKPNVTRFYFIFFFFFTLFFFVIVFTMVKFGFLTCFRFIVDLSKVRSRLMPVDCYVWTSVCVCCDFTQ